MPLLFAGYLGRTLHRVAQKRRHVVGEARTAAFRLTFTFASTVLARLAIAIAARLAGWLGFGVAVARLLLTRCARGRCRVAVLARRAWLLTLLRALLALFRPFLPPLIFARLSLLTTRLTWLFAWLFGTRLALLTRRFGPHFRARLAPLPATRLTVAATAASLAVTLAAALVVAARPVSYTHLTLPTTPYV